MKTAVQDSIVRQIEVDAPIERVYAAIAEPEQIVRWFPDGIEGSLNPGDRPVMDFGNYGKFSIYVVEAKPHSYFAYRWTPGAAYVPEGFIGDVLSIPNTLVEFHLETSGGKTKVRLVESGFASLPADEIEKALKDNNEGWDEMMDRLQKYVDGVAA